MSKRCRLTSTLLVIALGVLSAIALPVWAGNVHRSCKAFYSFHMSQAVDANNKWLVNIANVGSVHDSTFSARGGCGSVVPNRCRRRASEAAMKCMEAHARQPASTPAACKSADVQAYKVGNLEKALQQSVCDYMRNQSGVNTALLPKPYYVTTTLKATIVGDKGCGGGDRTKVVKDLEFFRISCPVGQ